MMDGDELDVKCRCDLVRGGVLIQRVWGRLSGQPFQRRLRDGRCV